MNNIIKNIWQRLKSIRLALMLALSMTVVAAFWIYKKEIKALENTANIFTQQIEALKGQIFMFQQLITTTLEAPYEPEELVNETYVFSLNYSKFLNSNGPKLHNQLHKIFSQSHSWLSASDLLYFKLLDSKTLISDLPISSLSLSKSELGIIFSREYCFDYNICSQYASKENLSDEFVFSNIHSSSNTHRKTLGIISPSIVNGKIVAESHVDVNLAQWESHADKFISSERQGEYMNIFISSHPKRSKYSWKITRKIDNFVSVTFERHFGILIVYGVFLLVFITTFISVIVFYLEEKNTHSKTKLDSMIDPLTGCFNRKMLESVILKKRMAEKEKSVVIAIDGNKIKYVNDKYGHDIGDIAIMSIAKSVKNSFRKDDIVIRTGGDEFVIIAPDLDVMLAYHIVDVVNIRLENSPIIDNEFVSVAAGIVCCKDFYDLKSAMKNADIILYQNKKNRNQQVERIKTQTEQI